MKFFFINTVAPTSVEHGPVEFLAVSTCSRFPFKSHYILYQFVLGYLELDISKFLPSRHRNYFPSLRISRISRKILTFFTKFAKLTAMFG